jgi:hypothetical protein
MSQDQWWRLASRLALASSSCLERLPRISRALLERLQLDFMRISIGVSGIKGEYELLRRGAASFCRLAIPPWPCLGEESFLIAPSSKSSRTSKAVTLVDQPRFRELWEREKVPEWCGSPSIPSDTYVSLQIAISSASIS